MDWLDFDEPRIKGFYVYSPFETKLQQKIILLFNKQLEKKGYLNYTFPTVGLFEDLKKEHELFELNNECFALNKDYFLKPTSEAVVYPFLIKQQFNNFKYYQVGPVFRNESKHCKKLVRSRQLAFFHESHAIVEPNLAEKTFQEATELYEEFFHNLGIKVNLVYRPPEDRFPGAEKTLAFDSVEENVQVGSIHLLKKDFLSAFGKTQKRVVCFGFTQRVQGVMKEIPIKYHPYPVVIINMTDKKIDLSGDFCVLTYDKKKLPFSKFMSAVDSFYKPLVKIKVGLKELSNNKIQWTYAHQSYVSTLQTLDQDLLAFSKDFC